MDQVQGSLIGKSPAWHVARVSKCVYRSRHTYGSCAHQCLRELSLPPAPCRPLVLRLSKPYEEGWLLLGPQAQTSGPAA